MSELNLCQSDVFQSTSYFFISPFYFKWGERGGGINCKQTSLRRKNKIKPKQNNQHVLLIVKYIVINSLQLVL